MPWSQIPRQRTKGTEEACCSASQAGGGVIRPLVPAAGATARLVGATSRSSRSFPWVIKAGAPVGRPAVFKFPEDIQSREGGAAWEVRVGAAGAAGGCVEVAMEQRVQQLEADLATAKKELAAKVKHYEGKLVTLTVINGALQTENEKLKEELERLQDGQPASANSHAEQELKELHAEFTKRLNAAEKTAHVMREECFGLRRQLEEAKKAREKKDAEIAEQSKTAEQYKKEGEQLSRKLGESDAALTRLRSDHARLEQERDRLVSRVQVLEAAAESVDASRSAALEETKEDLAATKQAMLEQKEHYNKLVESLRAERERDRQAFQERLKQEKQRAGKELGERESAIAARAAAIQQSLAASAKEAAEREDRLRDELVRMEARCRAAEAAQAEAQAGMSEATKPLIRQMEAMAAEHTRMEALLREREQELELARQRHAAEAAGLREQAGRAERSAAAAAERTRVAEAAAQSAREEARQAAARHRAVEEEKQAMQQRHDEALERAEAAEAAHREAMAALSGMREARDEAECSVAVMRLELEDATKQLRTIQQEEETATAAGAAGRPSRPLGSPPGQSLSREGRGDRRSQGVGGSQMETGTQGGGRKGGGSQQEHPQHLHNHHQQHQQQQMHSQVQGDSFSDAHAASPTAETTESVLAKALGGAPASSTAIVVEHLTSKLKLQTGEMAQLQRELKAAQAARDHANDELLKVSQRLLVLEKDTAQAPKLESELGELRRRHDMALVMLGERNERVEELEQDMADVKAMYREQVNLLVNQVDPEKWPQGYRICLFCPHCAQGQQTSGTRQPTR